MSLITAMRIGTVFGNEKKVKKDFVEQDFSEYVRSSGGDTLPSRDSTVRTISVIEYDDFQPVTSLMDQERKKVLNEIIDTDIVQSLDLRTGRPASNAKTMPFQGDAYEVFNKLIIDLQQI